MSTVQEIETAIERLSREELLSLVGWLRLRHAGAWDQQVEEDAKTSRLDFLWEEAAREIAEHRTVALNEVLDDKTLP